MYNYTETSVLLSAQRYMLDRARQLLSREHAHALLKLEGGWGRCMLSQLS